jgi:hypothetical protein
MTSSAPAQAGGNNAPGVYVYDPSTQNAHAPGVGTPNTMHHSSNLRATHAYVKNPLHYGLDPHRSCCVCCYSVWWGNVKKSLSHKIAMHYRIRYIKSVSICPECYILREPGSDDTDKCVSQPRFELHFMAVRRFLQSVSPFRIHIAQVVMCTPIQFPQHALAPNHAASNY